MNPMQNLDTTNDNGIDPVTTDRKRRVLVLLASLTAVAAIAGVAQFALRGGADEDAGESAESVQATDIASSPTSTATVLNETTTTVVGESQVTPGPDAPPVITSNTGGASGGTTGGTNGGTSGGSTGQHWEQVRCPNGLVGSVVVPDGQSASPEQVDFICSQTFPTTPPTTAPPLTITSLVPGYANAHGSPGPWQQAYCDYRWGLELSDGRVIWRSMTHSVPDSCSFLE